MNTSFARLLVSLAALFALSGAYASSAENLCLRPRYRAGDSYSLSLTVTTKTEASSRGSTAEHVDEDVRLVYRASVLVLEVDANEFPVREQHQRASLTFERTGESGSLFQEGTSFEVRRSDGIRLILGDERFESRLEKTVAGMLEKQFEYTLEPAFLDPGRSVEIGESWTPDASLARRFLLSRGLRVTEFGEGATVTLQRRTRDDGTSELLVDYSVPISRFTLPQMPPQAEASSSEALLTGQVVLPSIPRQAPTAAVSNLTLSLNGLSRGPSQSVPWTLRRSVVVEKGRSDGKDVADIHRSDP